VKAIRIHRLGGPEVLQYEDVPVPTAGQGEALVRVEAAGVNFIDVYRRTGLYKVELPHTLGQEGAGTVDAVGPGVTDVALGDRVAFTDVPGAYAQYAVAPADRLIPIPPKVNNRQAAAVILQGLTAHYLALATYPLEPGDVCLVHAAAGGVGLLLCQIAKRRGARVIATVSTEAKAELARGAGANEVILYTRQDFAAEVKRLTGTGVHVIYDSVGKTTFDKGLDCLHPRGMMVLCGQSSGPVPPVDPQILNKKGSLFLTRPTLFNYTATREELLARAGDVLGWVADGSLSVRIHREYPLADAASAQRALEGRETTGKVLLVTA
jgi:NADPH2:quinone reductase